MRQLALVAKLALASIELDHHGRRRKAGRFNRLT